MKLTIREDSKNYAVSVVKLPPKQPVVGLDRLVRVTIFGNDVLTQKDSDENQLYLFFPAECQISQEYLRLNNEFRHTNLNADPSAKPGFFEDSGRVKSIKFKGVISTGYIAPVSTLEVYGVPRGTLTAGDEFTTIDGKDLVKKYRPTRTPGTVGTNESRYNKKLKRFDKLVPHQFRFHVDTAQLAKNLHAVKAQDIVVVTNKVHGTSTVHANVLVNKQLSWMERAAKFFGVSIQDKQYDKLYSSRTVLKNQYINKEAGAGFYGEDVWGIWNKYLEDKLAEGITIYAEIIGYTPSGKPIQKGYAYGCVPGESKLQVYRITYTKPNGEVIEFSWQQIKDYCAIYGLETVEELYFGPAAELDIIYDDNGEIPWEDKLLSSMQKLYLEKDCKYNPGMPAEGVCLRVDGRATYMTYKLKSKRFFEHETKELDSGVVSIEDTEGEEAGTEGTRVEDLSGVTC